MSSTAHMLHAMSARYRNATSFLVPCGPTCVQVDRVKIWPAVGPLGGDPAP